MFSLPTKNPDNRYGLVVDIGSASVTAAIVESDPNADLPSLLWSHKERLPLERSKQKPENDIVVALTNAFLTVGSAGIQALIAHHSKAKITQCDVTIGAPWSYSVSRIIRSQDETPFEITQVIVDDLITKAEESAFEALQSGMKLEDIGLEIITESTPSITANGYITNSPVGKEVTEIEITRILGVARKNIVAAIQESHETILPKSHLRMTTFMFSYYQAIQSLSPNLSEVCLLDIGAEATELGVVKDGILSQTSHQPTGHYTIAADVMTATKVPAEEAVAAIKQDFATLFVSTTDTQRGKITKAITTYEESVTLLFENAEEFAAVPKQVYLHTDTGFESFFTPHIESAASSGNVTRDVKNVNATSFEMADFAEKKILVTSYVFHKKCYV